MADSFNLSAECLQFARSTPEATALVFARLKTQSNEAARFHFESWSFAAAEERVLAMARLLRKRLGGTGKASAAERPRVLLRLTHGPDFAFAFFAIIAAGAVAVPVSPQLGASEVEFLIADAEPALILHEPGLPLPDALNPNGAGLALYSIAALRAQLAESSASTYAATAPDDPAFLIYTSGTSGRPKGVLHAQRSVIGRRPMRAGWTGLGPDDRLLHAGQLNWTYSLGVGLMDPWVAGATAILYDGGSAGPARPELWVPLLKASRATIFAAVPALYRRILKYTPADDWATLQTFGALRHGLSAGESLSVELHARWCEISGRPLYEALGMSEVSTYISSGPATPTRPGLPGKPQPGRRIAVLDPRDNSPRECAPGEIGLLAVHRTDPGLMLGYWRRPDEDQIVYRGEWFTGGDLVRVESDGYLRYHGRNDDVMTVSGYRVAPLEIEQVLEAHPDVLEAGVREEPRGADLRIIVAYIVPREPERRPEAGLTQYLEERLAAYKRPRELHLRDRLPRTANGKLIRSAF